MSTLIYGQFADKGNAPDKKPSAFIVRTPKSAATKQAERLTGRYEAKSNTCPDCRSVRAANGACDC